MPRFLKYRIIAPCRSKIYIKKNSKADEKILHIALGKTNQKKNPLLMELGGIRKDLIKMKN